MTTTFVGIDPGTTGCLVVMDDEGIQFHDVPVYQIKVGKTKRMVYDEAAMARCLRSLAEKYSHLRVCIEEVHAMPKTGSQGNFGSGFGYGLWRGMMTMAGISFTTVQPAKWKKLLGIKRPDGDAFDSEKKNLDRMVACQMFPVVADQMSRVKDHGRADALLIAEYGRRGVSG